MKELSFKNAQVMADAMRRRVELMEESFTIMAFDIDTAESESDKRHRDEFFRLTRA